MVQSEIHTENVAICVATYKRPDGLRRLLRSLIALDPINGNPPTVVVIDNDPAGSAAAVIEEVAGENPEISFRYSVEIRKGISFARNRAIEEARDQTVLAFIDDDDEASPPWLKELLRVRNTYQAEVVGGPVIVAFEEPPPSWLSSERFFDLPRYPTGTPVGFVSTANMLVEREVLERTGLSFDEDFAETGGSDALFSMEARLAGLDLVWADEAVVTEWMPPGRATVRWHVRRGYRIGATLARCEVKIGASLRTRAFRLLKSIYRMSMGGVLILVGILTFSQNRLFWGLREGARGWGMLMGLFGRRFFEYRSDDESRAR